jgi:hypothetical protein
MIPLGLVFGDRPEATSCSAEEMSSAQIRASQAALSTASWEALAAKDNTPRKSGSSRLRSKTCPTIPSNCPGLWLARVLRESSTPKRTSFIFLTFVIARLPAPNRLRYLAHDLVRQFRPDTSGPDLYPYNAVLRVFRPAKQH